MNATINSKIYSFIDLFRTLDEEKDKDEFKLNKIEIPIIQRDYAQGRNIPEVKRIRKRFLDSLYESLTQPKPITLDFIYGETNKEGVLIPLDGQQRLTTLFLLHWYISRHEHVDKDKFQFLSNFSYATRYSAREFCHKLVSSDYEPNFNEETLSADITDQNWMPRDWQYDPTISAMLNMLDDIHRVFRNTSNLWDRLEHQCITFYFLPIKELGAPDELYIKMNSRGKPLTEFEHFKAEWEGVIKKVDEKLAQEVCNKIDLAWTDMLWPYRNSGLGTIDDNVIDDEFVRYFRFLTDIIYCESLDQNKESDDIFYITKDLFDKSNPKSRDHILFVEQGFDSWVNVDIEQLFSSVLTVDYDNNHDKSIVTAPLNVFADCCMNYGVMQGGGKRRKFPIGRVVLLYAFLYYLQHKDSINESQLARRLRILTNLIKGSEYELREDNLVNLIRQTRYILNCGDIEEGYTSFGANQLIEEHAKVEWLKLNEDKKYMLFKLEDHFLLQGAIRVIGLENVDYVDRFYSLFECDWGLVNCALLTIGDYSQLVNWRYQIGSKTNETTWRSIFKSKKEDLKETRRVLIELLDKAEKFSDEILSRIIADYLSQNDYYDWRHYLVKYSSMRPERFGMYYWPNYKDIGKTSYNIYMMWTEKSIGGRNHIVFLKALYDKLVSAQQNLSLRLGDYAYAEDGNRLELLFANKSLYFTDQTIVICHTETDESGRSQEIIDIEKKIPKCEDNIDSQDRVELAYDLVLSMIE